MPGPLLETKLHLPRRRRNVVGRPRLNARLARGHDSALTLVSAPAGFGKTTALSEWLASETAAGTTVAWVSLDATDNDPWLFWSYVVAALHGALPDAIPRSREILVAQGSIDTMLATLLNELSAVSGDVLLVLDDYHVIEATDVHDAVSFLVEHLPAHVGIVISSRADPSLPLARLRARGDLVEIRAADLRFTADETAAYLQHMIDRAVSEADIAALEARTEGWIAALQLAALSMQGRDDISEFIAGFAGDDRFVVDYLAGEVLHRQPEAVRKFLLHTCLLSRFTASLCNAVTGNDDGAAMLRALDEGNLFLVALDDRRTWYRYHHLFADVVRLRLLREDPSFVRELHRRAGAWFDEHDEPSEAFFHAIAAEDFGHAADIAERALPRLARGRQQATMRTWFAMLPNDAFDNRPVLNIGYVGSRMVSGDTTGVEARLTSIEHWLDEPEGAIVVDHEEYRRLPAQVAVYRAALARLAGDIEGTIAHAERALALVGPDDDLARGGAAGLLALARWSAGDLDEAHHWYSEAMRSLERGEFIADVLGCALALGDISIAQGRPDDAMSTFEFGLRLAREHNVVLGTADMHVAMSEVFLERNDLEAARRHLDAAEELGDHAGLPQNAYRSRVARAALAEAEGDISTALELLDDAARVYVSDYFPETHTIAERKARLLALDGDRRPVASGLVDPLSERELDVLRLLRTDLSGPDIARELMVSLNTMRTHTKSIYMKLGVNNRREAVTRAAELGL
jgi:LuxR family transcriptional regulator, maltose regulon positive regulatory protein